MIARSGIVIFEFVCVVCVCTGQNARGGRLGPSNAHISINNGRIFTIKLAFEKAYQVIRKPLMSGLLIRTILAALGRRQAKRAPNSHY